MEISMVTNHLMFNRALHIELLEIGIIKGDKEWQYRNVSSPFHRLYYIHEGEVIIRDSNADDDPIEYRLKAGDFYLIRSDTTMDYYAENPFKKSYVHLQYALYGSTDILAHCEAIVKLKLQRSIIEDFIRLTQDHSFESYLKGKSTLSLILAHVLKEINVQELAIFQKDHPYRPLLTYMEQNIDARMSVDEMADYCDQSVSDFSRKFKRYIGGSPKSYLHNLVLNKSRLLLATTDRSVKQIAAELGYSDSLYFSRFFKKYNGISPLQYRKKQMPMLYHK